MPSLTKHSSNSQMLILADSGLEQLHRESGADWTYAGSLPMLEHLH